MFRKLLIATLFLCGIALAQPPADPPAMHDGPGFGGSQRDFGPPGRHMLMPMGRWWKNSEVAKTLGLNDTQVQKIEKIFLDSRLKLIDDHANLEKEEVKLEPLLAAENPDEKAVLSAIDRITAARATEEKDFAEMAFAVRRVLTPEQWKKLRSMHPLRRRFSPPEDGPRQNSERRERDRDRPRDGAPGQPPAPPPGDDGAAPAPSK